MANEKTTLKNNITYLKSRRSGVEWAVGKPVEELREYITRVGHDIEKQASRLFVIEKEEAEIKEAEKARKASAKKAVWK